MFHVIIATLIRNTYVPSTPLVDEDFPVQLAHAGDALKAKGNSDTIRANVEIQLVNKIIEHNRNLAANPPKLEHMQAAKAEFTQILKAYITKARGTGVTAAAIERDVQASLPDFLQCDAKQLNPMDDRIRPCGVFSNLREANAILQYLLAALIVRQDFTKLSQSFNDNTLWHVIGAYGMSWMLPSICELDQLPACDTVNKEGALPIHMAAKRGVEDMVKHFVKYSDNYDQLDASGMTPLHYAIDGGFVEIVRDLMTTDKFVIDQPTRDGILPATLAIRNLDLAMLKCLVEEYQANLRLPNSDDRTPLQVANGLPRRDSRSGPIQDYVEQQVKIAKAKSEQSARLYDDAPLLESGRLLENGGERLKQLGTQLRDPEQRQRLIDHAKANPIKWMVGGFIALALLITGITVMAKYPGPRYFVLAGMIGAGVLGGVYLLYKRGHLTKAKHQLDNAHGRSQLWQAVKHRVRHPLTAGNRQQASDTAGLVSNDALDDDARGLHEDGVLKFDDSQALTGLGRAVSNAQMRAQLAQQEEQGIGSKAVDRVKSLASSAKQTARAIGESERVQTAKDKFVEFRNSDAVRAVEETANKGFRRVEASGRVLLFGEQDNTQGQEGDPADEAATTPVDARVADEAGFVPVALVCSPDEQETFEAQPAGADNSANRWEF